MSGLPTRLTFALFASLALLVPTVPAGPIGPPLPPMPNAASHFATAPSPVQNFSAAVQRIVTLLGVSGGGLLAIVWARVALSWFSNDITKKVQAKDRARDALIGTLLFVAALSGLLWGLARWVVTGT